MAGFFDLFSGGNFKRSIEQFAKENKWSVAEVDSDSAVIEFEMEESGNEQTIYIYRNEKAVDFSVPSVWSFESEDELPHELSTLLMRRNGELSIGNWCIEEDEEGNLTYCCEYSVDLRIMDAAYFKLVVDSLVDECEEMENSIELEEEEEE